MPVVFGSPDVGGRAPSAGPSFTPWSDRWSLGISRGATVLPDLLDLVPVPDRLGVLLSGFIEKAICLKMLVHPCVSRSALEAANR
jgi:hypothetical protein